MNEYIDLHTHSTASDGTDSPSRLVARAKELGLAAIALTDHDTVGGLAEAQEAGRRLDLPVVRGCEISTRTSLGPMHVLGLWLPENCEALKKMLAPYLRERDRRNEKIVEKLRGLGMDINMDEVLQHASGTPGRPHIARVLVSKKYAATPGEAFEKYLARGAAAHVPKSAPPARDVTRLLSDLGATVILAHPLHPPCHLGDLASLVRELSQDGLSGLEAWHSRQTPQQTEFLKNLAQKYNLLLSGGSDYHGKNKDDISLGVGTGNLRIPKSVMDNMIAHRTAQGLPC